MKVDLGGWGGGAYVSGLWANRGWLGRVEAEPPSGKGREGEAEVCGGEREAAREGTGKSEGQKQEDSSRPSAEAEPEPLLTGI